MGADEKTPLFPKGGHKSSWSRSRPPLYVYCAVGCAALNSVGLGYDISVTSGVAVLLKEDFRLSDRQIGSFIGVLHFVTALGSLLNQAVSDRFGRCSTFAAAQLVLMAGLVTLCAAGSFATLMIGRLLVGVGAGLGIGLGPLYMAEVSPAAHRGMLTSWAAIASNIGILLGFVANWVFSELPLGPNWRTMLACGLFLPTLLLILSLLVMPESPRWLVAQGFTEEAERVLRLMHPPGTDVHGLVREIEEQLQAEAERGVPGLQGWARLFGADATTRRMLLVGVGVAFAQQVNGSESVVLYSPEIFRDAGVASTNSGLFATTITVGAVKVLSIAASSLLLDGLGRRPLLLLSTCGMAVCQLLLALALARPGGGGWLAAGAVWAFEACFSAGIGPIAWLLPAEVFPLPLRAKAMSLAACVNRATSGIVVLTFLPLSGALGLSCYYLLFAGITAGTAAAAYCCVPETKQRSLEQLAEDFRSIGLGEPDSSSPCLGRSTERDGTAGAASAPLA